MQIFFINIRQVDVLFLLKFYIRTYFQSFDYVFFYQNQKLNHHRKRGNEGVNDIEIAQEIENFLKQLNKERINGN